LNQPYQQPDWQNRLPGEQWVLLDSVSTAEAYLTGYQGSQVFREPFPNEQGLYARIQFPDRIPQHRIYIALNSESP
jgi:hypothetical protein